VNEFVNSSLFESCYLGYTGLDTYRFLYVDIAALSQVELLRSRTVSQKPAELPRYLDFSGLVCWVTAPAALAAPAHLFVSPCESGK
jgi:hypothetical protein